MPYVQEALRNRAFTRDVTKHYFRTKANLILTLEKAFFLPDEDFIPRDRKRYFVALAALIEYMRAHDFPNAVVGEFIEMAQALAELDEGRSREWLKPSKSRRGRKVDPGDVWQGRALVSIALDVLIVDARMDKGEAVDLLDKHFGFLGDALLSTAAGTFSGAMAKWHQDFVARYGCEARAQETFDRRDSLIETISLDAQTADPHAIAIQLLNLATLEAARASTPAAIERFKKRLARTKPIRN
jgi:hypothetical protein